MPSVFDVANYILEKTGPVSSMKLQKLCYYSQAWALAWGEGPLFNEDFEAWANGPVCALLYSAHKGMFIIDKDDLSHLGNIESLSHQNMETIDKVVEFYGDKSAQWLSDLSHMERPWRDARHGIPDGERGQEVISKEDMVDYYGSL